MDRLDGFAISSLRAHPLLARLHVAGSGEVEVYHTGEPIVREGSIGDALYLILDGSVEVIKSERPLARLATGEFFGEMSLAEPVARSATVISVTRSTVFRIPHTTLQALLDTDPRALNQLLIAIVRVLSERLRRTNDMIGSVGNLADWAPAPAGRRRAASRHRRPCSPPRCRAPTT